MRIRLLSWLLLICVATTAYARPPGVKHFKNRVEAPGFVLSDTKDKIHRLVDYRGRVLVVNFWATWCVPCRREMPALMEAWDRLEKENIQLLGIATRDSKEAVMYYKDENKVDFPLPVDREGEVASNWAVLAVPTAYVIDPEGNIAMRIIGGNDWHNPKLIDSIIALKQKPISEIGSSQQTDNTKLPK